MLTEVQVNPAVVSFLLYLVDVLVRQQKFKKKGGGGGGGNPDHRFPFWNPVLDKIFIISIMWSIYFNVLHGSKLGLGEADLRMVMVLHRRYVRGKLG